MARHGWWIGRDVLSLGSLNLIRWATKWTSCWTQKSPQDFSTDSFHAPLSSSDLILLTFPRDPLLTWNELGYAMQIIVLALSIVELYQDSIGTMDFPISTEGNFSSKIFLRYHLSFPKISIFRRIQSNDLNNLSIPYIIWNLNL